TVWTRGILIEEFGLDTNKVNWVVDDEEHVVQLKLPKNVTHAPSGVSLADMMAKGDLQAGFAANAGIGRTGHPTRGWKEVEANYPDLFPNAAELDEAAYKKDGIFPMHGTVVVKEWVLKQYPWVAKSLSNAFTQAKDIWLKKFQAGQGD